MSIRIPGDEDFLIRSEHEEEKEITGWFAEKLKKEYPEFNIVQTHNWEHQFSPFYIFRIWVEELCIAEISDRSGGSTQLFAFLEGWKAHKRKVNE